MRSTSWFYAATSEHTPAPRRDLARRGTFWHTTLTSNWHADGLVGVFAQAARDAGELALGFFRPGERTSAEVSHKEGGSPVTEADYLVDRFLKQRLEPLLPEAGWLSEETVDLPLRLSKDLVLVVDPIDGTRGFASGDPLWAIAVALVRDGRPIIGVVHAPALAADLCRGSGRRCVAERRGNRGLDPNGSDARGPRSRRRRASPTNCAEQASNSICSRKYRRSRCGSRMSLPGCSMPDLRPRTRMIGISRLPISSWRRRGAIWQVSMEARSPIIVPIRDMGFSPPPPRKFTCKSIPRRGERRASERMKPVWTLPRGSADHARMRETVQFGRIHARHLPGDTSRAFRPIATRRREMS